MKDSKQEPENNVFKDMMRAVVREELTPLYQKFSSVEAQIDLFTSAKLRHLETALDKLENRFAAFQERIEATFRKMETDIDKLGDRQKDA